MEKKNNLDHLPLAELGEGELEQVRELEKNLSKKYNSKIFLMALENTEGK